MLIGWFDLGIAPGVEDRLEHCCCAAAHDYPTHDKATQAALILLTQDIPYCGDPPCNEATGPVLVAKPFSFGV
uniref:Uncharacterized protein n=1 Tax=Oryza barthii TaxID=65489 RepID=A0A0D3FTF0_9ORYZ